MGEGRGPLPCAVQVGLVLLGLLLVAIFLLVEIDRSLDELGNPGGEREAPDELESVLGDVLVDAPASQRSRVDRSTRVCRSVEGSGDSSAVSQVWTVLPGDRGAAIDRVEERAVAQGYARAPVGDRVARDGPAPLRYFERVEDPSFLELHVSDVRARVELTVRVYEACPS